MGTPGVPLGITELDIVDAIKKHGGTMKDAAAELRICRTYLWDLIREQYPHLYPVIDKAREDWDRRLIEDAETFVRRCVKYEFEDPKIALDASKFTLKSKGRKRKWDVVEDESRKGEGAMVDKMKSMEVVE